MSEVKKECTATQDADSPGIGLDWPEFVKFYENPQNYPLCESLKAQIQALNMPSKGSFVKGMLSGNLPDVDGLADIPDSILVIIKTLEIQSRMALAQGEYLREQNAILRKGLNDLAGVVHKISHSNAKKGSKDG